MTAFKVLVKSPFSIFSGYGNDGYGMVRALVKWGCDVYVQPTWLDVPVPPDLLRLFSKPLEPPFDLTINHWDPSNLLMEEPARRCTRVAVAWTMWEFTKLAPICPRRKNLRKRIQWFDLILGYDDVSVQALRPYIAEHQAIAKLQGGYESADWKYMERDWTGERFGFGMHGALNNRKAPMTVIQAFQNLKAEHPEEFAPATLALHTTTPGPLFPELNEILAPQKIRVFVGVWPQETVTNFYKSCHALVYPSQGEGKNLPALEHLTTGGTVIATNHSGHTEWLGEHLGYPLPFSLVPVLPESPRGARSALVSVQAVRDAMWHVFTHRDEARERGRMGSDIIPKQCDWMVVVENLFRRIRDNVPQVGEVVWNMAQEARREAARK